MEVDEEDQGAGGYADADIEGRVSRGSGVERLRQRADALGRRRLVRRRLLGEFAAREAGLPLDAVGSVLLHKDLRVIQPRKRVFAVQLVRVPRGEHSTPEALKLKVGEDGLDQPLAQVLASVLLKDEHIRQVGEVARSVITRANPTCSEPRYIPNTSEFSKDRRTTSRSTPPAQYDRFR